MKWEQVCVQPLCYNINQYVDENPIDFCWCQAPVSSGAYSTECIKAYLENAFQSNFSPSWQSGKRAVCSDQSLTSQDSFTKPEQPSIGSLVSLPPSWKSSWHEPVTSLECSRKGPGALLASLTSPSSSYRTVTHKNESHMGIFVEHSGYERGREVTIKGQCGSPAPPPVGPDCTVRGEIAIPGDWGCTVGASEGEYGVGWGVI